MRPPGRRADLHRQIMIGRDLHVAAIDGGKRPAPLAVEQRQERREVGQRAVKFVDQAGLDAAIGQHDGRRLQAIGEAGHDSSGRLDGRPLAWRRRSCAPSPGGSFSANVRRDACDLVPSDRRARSGAHLYRRSVPRRARQDDGPRTRRHRGDGRRQDHALRPGRADRAPACRPARDPRLRPGRADLRGLRRQPCPLPADADDRGLRRAAARLAEQVHLPDRAQVRRQGICPRGRHASSCRRTCATASPRAASIAPSIRSRSTRCSRRRRSSDCGSPPARC